MPTYEFRCQDCQTLFTVRRSFSQAGDAAACPDCDSIRTRKAFAAVAFIGSASRASESLPVPLSGGGCGCGGSCACSA